MDETLAIKLCLKHQDPVGFEYLVKKYRREALFHARSLLGNQEDAADACQESFTRAYMAFPRMTQLDKFYPWFYRILRNCCLNMLSRKKTAVKYQQVKQRDPQTGIEPSNPSLLLEKSEEREIVWKALGELQTEFREILVMKYIQGLSYEEIAALLNIPRGTVMSRLYYARKSFKEHFETPEKSRKELVS
jgi:RNA polymerase sigma-70 factor (ECF subfamily)